MATVNTQLSQTHLCSDQKLHVDTCKFTHKGQSGSTYGSNWDSGSVVTVYTAEVAYPVAEKHFAHQATGGI